MATYKVIQDIEAEDKLIGPFGIRQFIYLIIVVVSGFIAFKLATSAWFLALPLLPHTLFFALLAMPFGGDQPTETWLLAKIRFMLKPRRRIWDQTGASNLVTITAPKKMEKILKHDLSESEVRSRLQALANTIDSRGWAIKNVNANVFTPAYAGLVTPSSDRLIDVGSVQTVPDYTITPMDDMLDEQNNPRAQNLEQLIKASSKAHREQIVNRMKNAQQGDSTPNSTQPIANTNPAPSTPPSNDDSGVQPQPDYWFLSQNSSTGSLTNSYGANASSTIVTPDPAALQQQTTGLPLQPLAPSSDPISEEELLDKIHAKQNSKPKNHGNLKVIKTLDEQQADEAAKQREAEEKTKKSAAFDSITSDQPVTPAPDPDIIELARNDDLNVETVARQAKKSKEHDLPDGEVVINLH